MIFKVLNTSFVGERCASRVTGGCCRSTQQLPSKESPWGKNPHFRCFCSKLCKTPNAFWGKIFFVPLFCLVKTMVFNNATGSDNSNH